MRAIKNSSTSLKIDDYLDILKILQNQGMADCVTLKSGLRQIRIERPVAISGVMIEARRLKRKAQMEKSS
jgi:hypothetical protein